MTHWCGQEFMHVVGIIWSTGSRTFKQILPDLIRLSGALAGCLWSQQMVSTPIACLHNVHGHRLEARVDASAAHLSHGRCRRRCDIMIHTANEFTAKHRRSLLSTTTMGLDSLPAPGEAPLPPGDPTPSFMRLNCNEVIHML